MIETDIGDAPSILDNIIAGQKLREARKRQSLENVEYSQEWKLKNVQKSKLKKNRLANSKKATKKCSIVSDLKCHCLRFKKRIPPFPTKHRNSNKPGKVANRLLLSKTQYLRLLSKPKRNYYAPNVCGKPIKNQRKRSKSTSYHISNTRVARLSKPTRAKLLGTFQKYYKVLPASKLESIFAQLQSGMNEDIKSSDQKFSKKSKKENRKHSKKKSKKRHCDDVIEYLACKFSIKLTAFLTLHCNRNRNVQTIETIAELIFWMLRSADGIHCHYNICSIDEDMWEYLCAAAHFLTCILELVYCKYETVKKRPSYKEYVSSVESKEEDKTTDNYSEDSSHHEEDNIDSYRQGHLEISKGKVYSYFSEKTQQEMYPEQYLEIADVRKNRDQVVITRIAHLDRNSSPLAKQQPQQRDLSIRHRQGLTLEYTTDKNIKQVRSAKLTGIEKPLTPVGNRQFFLELDSRAQSGRKNNVSDDYRLSTPMKKYPKSAKQKSPEISVEQISPKVPLLKHHKDPSFSAERHSSKTGSPNDRKQVSPKDTKDATSKLLKNRDQVDSLDVGLRGTHKSIDRHEHKPSKDGSSKHQRQMSPKKETGQDHNLLNSSDDSLDGKHKFPNQKVPHSLSNKELKSEDKKPTDHFDDIKTLDALKTYEAPTKSVRSKGHKEKSVKDRIKQSDEIRDSAKERSPKVQKQVPPKDAMLNDRKYRHSSQFSNDDLRKSHKSGSSDGSHRGGKSEDEFKNDSVGLNAPKLKSKGTKKNSVKDKSDDDLLKAPKPKHEEELRSLKSQKLEKTGSNILKQDSSKNLKSGSAKNLKKQDRERGSSDFSNNLRSKPESKDGKSSIDTTIRKVTSQRKEFTDKSSKDSSEKELLGNSKFGQNKDDDIRRRHRSSSSPRSNLSSSPLQELAGSPNKRSIDSPKKSYDRKHKYSNKKQTSKESIPGKSTPTSESMLNALETELSKSRTSDKTVFRRSKKDLTPKKDVIRDEHGLPIKTAESSSRKEIEQISTDDDSDDSFGKKSSIKHEKGKHEKRRDEGTEDESETDDSEEEELGKKHKKIKDKTKTKKRKTEKKSSLTLSKSPDSFIGAQDLNKFQSGIEPESRSLIGKDNTKDDLNARKDRLPSQKEDAKRKHSDGYILKRKNTIEKDVNDVIKEEELQKENTRKKNLSGKKKNRKSNEKDDSDDDYENESSDSKNGSLKSAKKQIQKMGEKIDDYDMQTRKEGYKETRSKTKDPAEVDKIRKTDKKNKIVDSESEASSESDFDKQKKKEGILETTNNEKDPAEVESKRKKSKNRKKGQKNKIEVSESESSESDFDKPRRKEDYRETKIKEKSSAEIDKIQKKAKKNKIVDSESESSSEAESKTQSKKVDSKDARRKEKDSAEVNKFRKIDEKNKIEDSESEQSSETNPDTQSRKKSYEKTKSKDKDPTELDKKRKKEEINKTVNSDSEPSSEADSDTLRKEDYKEAKRKEKDPTQADKIPMIDKKNKIVDSESEPSSETDSGTQSRKKSFKETKSKDKDPTKLDKIRKKEEKNKIVDSDSESSSESNSEKQIKKAGYKEPKNKEKDSDVDRIQKKDKKNKIKDSESEASSETDFDQQNKKADYKETKRKDEDPTEVDKIRKKDIKHKTDDSETEPLSEADSDTQTKNKKTKGKGKHLTQVEKIQKKDKQNKIDTSESEPSSESDIDKQNNKQKYKEIKSKEMDPSQTILESEVEFDKSEIISVPPQVGKIRKKNNKNKVEDSESELLSESDSDMQSKTKDRLDNRFSKDPSRERKKIEGESDLQKVDEIRKKARVSSDESLTEDNDENDKIFKELQAKSLMKEKHKTFKDKVKAAKPEVKYWPSVPVEDDYLTGKDIIKAMESEESSGGKTKRLKTRVDDEKYHVPPRHGEMSHDVLDEVIVLNVKESDSIESDIMGSGPRKLFVFPRVKQSSYPSRDFKQHQGDRIESSRISCPTHCKITKRSPYMEYGSNYSKQKSFSNLSKCIIPHVNIMPHGTDKICCASLRAWALWIKDVAESSKVWCQWINEIICDMQTISALMRGELYTENGMKRVLTCEDWRNFVHRFDSDICIWHHYNKHVQKNTKQILSYCNCARVTQYCNLCQRENLQCTNKNTHNLYKKLAVALKTTKYWRTWLHSMVLESQSLFDLIEASCKYSTYRPKCICNCDGGIAQCSIYSIRSIKNK